MFNVIKELVVKSIMRGTWDSIFDPESVITSTELIGVNVSKKALILYLELAPFFFRRYYAVTG